MSIKPDEPSFLNGSKTAVPSWFIKSLAWAFIVGLLAWVAYAQNRMDEEQTIHSKQSETITVYQTHLEYIRESLGRIEEEIKQIRNDQQNNKEKGGT